MSFCFVVRARTRGCSSFDSQRRQKVCAALWACEVSVSFSDTLQRDEWKCGNAVAGRCDFQQRWSRPRSLTGCHVCTSAGSWCSITEWCCLGYPHCSQSCVRITDTMSMPGIPDWFCSFEIRFPCGQNQTWVQGCSFGIVCCDYLLWINWIRLPCNPAETFSMTHCPFC